jgi:glucose-6-phosphate isomerase
MKPEALPSWKALSRLASEHVRGREPAAELIVEAAGLYVDLSKHRLDERILNSLMTMATDRALDERIEDLFTGRIVNFSEGRAALHTALRASEADMPALARPARAEMDRALAFADAVRDGRHRGTTGETITTVVHIGIGGSHLGPELAVEALSQPSPGGPRITFVANIDAEALDRALAGIDPHRTLFIVASKSFSTLETRINAQSARSWFLERTGSVGAIASHFVAISANVDAAREFGIPSENVFAMWDWVGGRYSVWSPVGLPVALAIGSAGFRQFLAGAREIDLHFRAAPFEANLPVLMALIGIWNYNFLGINNQAILPYAERLRLLPDFLQQLTMESNGKSVHQDGTPVGIHTMPVVWGGRGTNGQHAFHQLLHQGTRSFAADFILVGDASHASAGTPRARDAGMVTRLQHQRWLLANGLAQSQAMLQGHEDDDPHRRIRGGKGTTTVVLSSLTPAALGALIALYEHVVFCQGVIWNINSFDQWGVELGKRLAVPIYEQLGGKPAVTQDPSTRGLIRYLIGSTEAKGSTEDD